MTGSRDSEQYPSLLRTTVRRSLVLGRLFFVIGLVYIVVLALALSATAAASFESAFPIFLPVFTVLGSMGALMVFSNDRTKGVFEYLIAYGISPRRLFVNFLLASLVLVVVMLALTLGIGLGVYLAFGHTPSITLVASLGIYSIPMSFASAAFASTVGMYWTSLSSPRSGLSSPIGLMPFIGLAPSLITLAALVVVALAGNLDVYLVIGIALAVVVAIVLALLGLIDRSLSRERLLATV